MWTISSLKARGKAAFQANYWSCVLVALILMIMAGSTAGRSGANAYESAQQYQNLDQYIAESIQEVPQVNVEVSVGSAAGGIFIILLALLVFAPLRVGCLSFFKKNSEFGPEKIDELKSGFVPSWGRNVLSMFLTSLFAGLWTLLFIIPGIVKAYSYRMVPYILADDANIDAVEAITLSRKMMDGHKWDAFVLDLSFIGWFLLSIVTLGIAQIFYVGPYKEATNAELYLALRAEYTQKYMQ